MAQLLGSLPPMWQIHNEFLATSFGLSGYAIWYLSFVFIHFWSLVLQACVFFFPFHFLFFPSSGFPIICMLHPSQLSYIFVCFFPFVFLSLPLLSPPATSSSSPSPCSLDLPWLWEIFGNLSSNVINLHSLSSLDYIIEELLHWGHRGFVL